MKKTSRPSDSGIFRAPADAAPARDPGRLATFLEGLRWAHLHHLRWFARATRRLFYPTTDDLPAPADECPFGRFLAGFADDPLRDSVLFRRIESHHRGAHAALERMLVDGAAPPAEADYARFCEQVLMLSDAVEREKSQAVFLLAGTDRLTGLLNRSALDVFLQDALRRGAPVAVAIADLDHFKDVNDTHGHGVGDEVLVEVARRFTRELRAYDTVFRIGGEEFLFLLPDTRGDAAHEVMERVRASIAEEPVVTDAGGVGLTVSVGIALGEGGEATDTEALVGAADRCLYQAKESGRNRVVGPGCA